MTRDIGLGPAQLLVILAMSLVLVIVMRWVVSLGSATVIEHFTTRTKAFLIVLN